MNFSMNSVFYLLSGFFLQKEEPSLTDMETLKLEPTPAWAGSQDRTVSSGSIVTIRAGTEWREQFLQKTVVDPITILFYGG